MYVHLYMYICTPHTHIYGYTVANVTEGFRAMRSALPVPKELLRGPVVRRLDGPAGVVGGQPPHRRQAPRKELDGWALPHPGLTHKGAP